MLPQHELMLLTINNNTLKHSFFMDDSLHIWFLDHIFFIRSLVDIIENCNLDNFVVG